jgi:type VI secretion system secreted protein VgrG
VKVGTGQFVEAGNEIHYYAGSKVVIDAGMELTASGGGSFLKLDPGGVTLSGATIKMNSGGAPGVGTGIGIVLPIIPGVADADKAGDKTQQALVNSPQASSPERLRLIAQDGLLLSAQCHQQPNGTCPLETCPCGKNSQII